MRKLSKHNTMITSKVRPVLFLLLSGVFVLSCKITRPYQQPEIKTDALYRDHSTTDTTSLAAMHWQNLFTDTALKALISEGLQHLSLIHI